MPSSRASAPGRAERRASVGRARGGHGGVVEQVFGHLLDKRRQRHAGLRHQRQLAQRPGLAQGHRGDALLAQGRRRLAFVGGPFDMRQVRDRLDGARWAVENADVAASLEVIATDALSVEEGVAAGRRILERPPGQRPDAVFAANDLVALGVLQSLSAGGSLLVPEQIALIGFDDISFAAAAAVPISSMQQPARAIGQTALRILLEEVGDPGLIPRQTVFRPELVARASTRPRP